MPLVYRGKKYDDSPVPGVSPACAHTLHPGDDAIFKGRPVQLSHPVRTERGNLSHEKLVLEGIDILTDEPVTEWLSSVDKVRVVPVVESNGDGGLERFARRIVGIAGRGANVSPARETAPLVGAGHAAIGLCFEILFPNVVTARRPKIATALINLADNSWIRDPAVSRQLITIARYRAIEQRLPLLRIAHGAGSAHYDAYGRLVDSLPQDRYGALVVDADPTRAPQLRERASILALPVGAAMTAWFLYPPIWSRSSG